MDPAVKKILDELNAAFATFRSANDERLKALETKGTADPILVGNVEKANKAVSDLSTELKTVQDTIKEIETAQARLAPSGSPEAQKAEAANAQKFLSFVRNRKIEGVSDDDMSAYRAYKLAFVDYLRRGDQALESAAVRDALRTGAAPDGGFWLVPETTGKIIEWIEDLSTMRQFASVDTIGTDTLEDSYDLDEADSGWVGETGARSETNTPRIDGKYTITVHEQYANPRTTQKMLDDSEKDPEAWLAKKVGNKMAKRENTSFLTGNGITQPFGILTKTAGTPARTSVAAYRVIRQMNSGASGAFAAVNPADKFLDIIVAIPSELRKGAVFAMNQLVQAEVRKIKDGEGRYIFIPDFAANPSGSILGHAIAEFNGMPDLGAASLSIAFANFKEAYQIVDHRVGMRTLRDPFTAKPYIQFYTTKRVGGDVVNYQAIVLMKFSA